MGDRVPICTLPGLVSAYVGSDVKLALAGDVLTITRVFLQRTDVVSGTVTASVRNTAAGGGDGIAVSLTGTETEKEATGSVAVTALQDVFFNVSAADPDSMNLRGWFEIDVSAAVLAGVYLTNIAQIKTFLGITGSADDAFLNQLVADVSDELQGQMRRRVVQTTATDEKHSPNGRSHILQLHNFPLVSVAELTEDNSVLAEDVDFESLEYDRACGHVIRINGAGGDPISWSSGLRNTKITYDHGYSAIPAAVMRAATERAVFDYQQSESGQKRFGLRNKSHDTGGTAQYSTRQELVESQAARLQEYTRVGTL